MAHRYHHPGRLLPALCLVLLMYSGMHALAAQFGEWTTSPAAAKALALQFNRPIVAVVGSPICPHCDNFDVILKSAAFLDYARQNQLVLFHNRENSSLRAQMTNDFKTQCGMTSLLPFLFLFKVKESADTQSDNVMSMAPDQIELLKISSGPYTGKLAGVNYTSDAVVNGIKLENESKWTVDTLTKVLRSFFPNQGWSTLSPSDDPIDDDPIDDDPIDDDPVIDDPVPIIDESWVATWTEDPAEAKALAYAHNRPILAIVGSPICPHCDNLDKVIITDAMLQYAKARKLVLFHCRNNSSLRSQITNDFKVPSGMTSLLPFLFLFKVKDGVSAAQLAENSMSAQHVTLLEISSGTYAGKKSGVNYTSETVINGIKLEKEQSWTLATFFKVIESFFPNKQYPSGDPGWNSIIPPVVGPTGYEQAVDLGRIPNPDYPASSGPGWIKYAPAATFIGSSSEHWYKFTGDAGKRYLCVAKDFQDTNNPIAIALYASNTSGAPSDPPIFTATSTGFDALGRGLFMDIPTGGANNQLFYLRLSHSGGTASTALPYGIKVHETHKNPVVGTVTNPLWRGAQKGLWTMDADKARERAAAEGVPLLFYFTGVLWCPYCIGLDHMVFSSTTFKDSIKNAYLVLIDNRQRNDTGPSLLLDNRANGYLASNSISGAAATAQLANNLTLQNALALPGASTAGWSHGRRISYPTLVYCNVSATTRADLTGVNPIGRFSYQDFTGLPIASKAKAFIDELALLASKGHREANASPQTSQLQLPAPGTAAEALTGGLANGNWYRFTVNQDQSGFAWLFNARATTAADAAQVELAVYSADGVTLLRRTQGSLKNGSSLEFVPPSADGGQYWLAISPSAQASAVPLTLNYQLEQLNYTIALEHDEVAVASSDLSFDLPLQLTTQLPNDNAVRFAYRIRTFENGAPASYFATPNVWQEATWTADEKQSGRKLLSLPLAVPAGEYWTGSHDVVIELQSIAGGNCRVSSNGEESSVKIFSQAFFVRPAPSAYGLFVGRRERLSFGIRNYDAQKHIVSVTPALPAGLSYQLNDAAPSRGVSVSLMITGTPTNAVTNHQVSLEIRDQANVLCDLLPVAFNVINLTGTIADRNVYAGRICPDNSGVGAPLGSLSMSKNATGLQLTLHSTSTAEALSALVNWQGYDPAKDQYYLSFTWSTVNARIDLTLDTQGNGRGTFTAPSGEEQTVFFAPVTQNPANFAGTYNVALRPQPATPPHPYDGFALGWLRLTVDTTGNATYSGELIDGTTLAGTSAITEAADGSGRMIFFAPLNWNSTLGRYQGRIAGQLAITPLPLRYEPGAGFNDACVYDCTNAIWARSATDKDAIQPCGTTYQAVVSLTNQAGLAGQGLDFLYEVQQSAQDSQTVVPDLIFLAENSSGSALLPRNDNPLAVELSSLAINTATGVISGNVNVLFAAQVGQPLLREAVPLRGILTPITSDCCSAGADLFLGYGYFTRRGTPYVFRLSAQSAVQNSLPVLKSIAGLAPTTPVRPINAGEVAVQIQSAGKRILYQRQYSNDLFLADWSAAAADFTELTLATAATWQFVALSRDKTASAPLLVAIPRQTTLGSDPDSGKGALHPGWNLIGIPADRHYTVLDNDGGTILAYDNDASAYTTTSELNGGLAYWVFVPDDDFAATIAQMEQPAPGVVITPGWSFLALPTTPLLGNITTWYWNGWTFTLTPPSDVPAPGVWLYNPTQP
ncbi:hypothetical protein [Oligosphaera ethanolica]|uniref:Thioredoxin-related protein n=1 Tax=Oligosphaera ethanolica TaxID=760260 RepID=A0AAE3VDS1_9BACT|nr:hypothetical protein [Oligosphaera ethanolica]MDQ0288443.1 thioredoxin-related protein [Oligosphaera ethanolica]